MYSNMEVNTYKDTYKWNTEQACAIKFYIAYFSIINGIPYEKISENGQSITEEAI